MGTQRFGRSLSLPTLEWLCLRLGPLPVHPWLLVEGQDTDIPLQTLEKVWRGRRGGECSEKHGAILFSTQETCYNSLAANLNL